MYFVCVYPGCKTLLPKIVACEGPLIVIMMTGSLKKKKKIKEKRGCSLIRACSLIRSNTVCMYKLYFPTVKTDGVCSYFPVGPVIHYKYMLDYGMIHVLHFASGVG